MQTSLRLLLVVLFAAWTSPAIFAATTKSQEKKSASPESSAKKAAPAQDADKDETTPVMTPAAVSTISVEDLRDFDKYPKQIQSLVQSSMALTRLDLGYLYGSHEPSKGGMDCSGTIYHVLHFQGLKDVPRQSDEMCQWVDKKSQLHLTPTATSFDSNEFDALKPGDLLFWTNTTKTTRKLPVTHVMIYLGKLKKSGRRIVFGSSDGRSFHGERRSGVSVFDFSLPREGSTSRFYGYGPSPGLLPAPPEPEPPVIAAVTPPAPKETPAVKATVAAKEPAALKESPAPKPSSASKEPPAPKEEIRKAVAVVTEAPPESVNSNTDTAEAKTSAAKEDAKPAVKKTTVADTSAKSTTTSKPKTSSTKKKTTTVSARRRTPPPPPKSVIEQRINRAVSSVRRFFQR